MFDVEIIHDRKINIGSDFIPDWLELNVGDVWIVYDTWGEEEMFLLNGHNKWFWINMNDCKPCNND